MFRTCGPNTWPRPKFLSRCLLCNTVMQLMVVSGLVENSRRDAVHIEVSMHMAHEIHRQDDVPEDVDIDFERRLIPRRIQRERTTSMP